MNHHLSYLLKKAELNLYNFNVSRADKNKMNFRNRVFRSQYTMSYNKSGTLKLRIGKEVRVVYPGSVLFIPPDLLHDQYKDDETDDISISLWWIFSFKVEQMIDVLSLFQIPVVYTLKDPDKFEQLFNDFIKTTKNQDYLPDILLQKAKSLELLSLLLDDALKSENGTKRNLAANNFIHLLCNIIQHPEKNFSLNALAEEMHLSVSYISRRFHKLYGVSPIQLHKKVKIEKAKSYLISSKELSITDISERLAFQEVQYFTRLFKKYTGISPLAYRKAMNEDKQGDLFRAFDR